MASWLMQRRILSLLASKQLHTSFRNESSRLLPSAYSFFRGEEFYRSIQTFSKPSKQTVENVEEHEPCSSKADSNSGNDFSGPISNKNSEITYTAKSSLKTSPRHDLGLMFTCKVCETRSFKTLSRESYEKGVVVAQCGGCNNYHLIADHLGMFGDPGSIEDILAARGEEVKKGSSDTLNLTLEDLVGTKS